MFDNIGVKIKSVSKWVGVIGIILSALIGLVLMGIGAYQGDWYPHVFEVLIWVGTVIALIGWNVVAMSNKRVGTGLVAAGAVIAFIASAASFSRFDNGFILVCIGASVMIFGSLLCWIWSLFTYGFGELVENSKILSNLMGDKNAIEKNDGQLQSESSATSAR